jgi:hypothetical protein
MQGEAERSSRGPSKLLDSSVRQDPASRMQSEAGMQGAITGRDVLVHSMTILRLWGPAFYVRCLRVIASRRPCTFLEVLASER